MPGRHDEVVLIYITSIALILLLGTIIAVVLFIQKKRKYQYRQQLSEMKGHYEKALLQTKLKILEETFRAISQSLHDNIGSNISTAMLLLYKDDKIDSHEQELNRKEALLILDKIVDDLRNIAHSINPDYLDEIGLNEAIKLRVEQLIKTKKYKIDLCQNEAPQRLNRQKQLILFYVFQEAVNNINTHSQASTIAVRLKYDINHLLLQITDDGKGMDINHEIPENKKKGNGLLNMKNHAALIGANLNIISETGKGTDIMLSVPDPYR